MQDKPETLTKDKDNQFSNSYKFQSYLHSIKVDEFGESRIVLIADSSQLARTQGLINQTQKLLDVIITPE